MTNEDDYTIAHTNTPRTSPTGSILANDMMDDDANDVIEVAHKIVGWKITPRVSNYSKDVVRKSIWRKEFFWHRLNKRKI